MDLSLIIFAALALFLAYRLYEVLGSRGGHEPEEHERPVLRPVGGQDAAQEAEAEQPEPEAKAAPMPEWATAIVDVYPRFDPQEFLVGAARAYEMVVQGFAEGSLKEVSSFVDTDVLASFQEAIEARKFDNRTIVLTFVGMEEPEVTDVDVQDREIRLQLLFSSEQVRATKNADGEVIEGNEEKVIAVEDRWTFARPTGSNDPNWTLVAT